jgi:predicted acetyltransferase
MLADNRAGVNLPERLVPSTFLVADVDGQFVGRVTIRHRLNEFLRVEGGHIGYNVLPGFRRRGHATEILRQALIVARSMGIDRVLVTTDDDNVGSIAVIESNGGKLDSVRPATGTMPAHRLYWID